MTYVKGRLRAEFTEGHCSVTYAALDQADAQRADGKEWSTDPLNVSEPTDVPQWTRP
jgi:hypothetical protein